MVMAQKYTLIVTEKPTAAATLAKALGNKITTHEANGVKYYEIKHKGKTYIIAPAAGHLFTLKQSSKGWDYPRFDIEWVPSHIVTRRAEFAKKYFDTLSELAKKASDIIIATDYDEEGEVIGYNILKFLCNGKRAKRMRFSTMTKEELLKSFESMGDIDYNLVEAGYTRHFVDWYFGINFTRALTNAIRCVGKRFAILSTGRVQGPTLKILADKEREIKAFKPKTYWQLFLHIKVGNKVFRAEYTKEKIWKKRSVESVLKKIKNKKAKVLSVTKRVVKQSPPIPYDTTTFLSDAYRYFGYSPTQAMRIAEDLYQRGYISYPRTSSQKLPSDINFREILEKIGSIQRYGKYVNKIFSLGKLEPKQGKKSDPAHPAIYPTAEVPKKLGSAQAKIYDLIVHRFLAVFGPDAKRESKTIILSVGGEKFKLTGATTVEKGWLELYGKYAQREEAELPNVNQGEEIEVVKIEPVEKQTTPPPRYSQGSILKEMEARNLGTKATRPQILQILYDRGYIVGKSIEVTDIGINLINILEKHVPLIVSEELTRRLEEDCDLVQNGKKKREEVLNEAKKIVTEICKEFKQKEKDIGRALTAALISSHEKQSTLGTCPKCGGTLRVFVMRGKGTRFVGCENYKKGCSFSAPLPKSGTIIPTGKTCEHCNTPIIQVSRPGARPFRMCLDIQCPTKKDWLDKRKVKKIKSGNKKKKS